MEGGGSHSPTSTSTKPRQHGGGDGENHVIINAEERATMEPEEEGRQRQKSTRAENARSTPEPTPAVLLQGWLKEQNESRRSLSGSSSTSQRRTRSPYSRSHLRSRSMGTAALQAPSMMRAHSLPNPQTPRPFDGTTSPQLGSLSPSPLRDSRSPRTRSPFRQEDVTTYCPPRFQGSLESPAFLGSTGGGSSHLAHGGGLGIESIQEDSELDIAPRGAAPSFILPFQTSSQSSRSNSLRSTSAPNNRRPVSPLHSVTTPPPTSFPAGIIDQNAALHTSSYISTSNPTSTTSSPSLGPTKYNEVYPFTLHHAAQHLHQQQTTPTTHQPQQQPTTSNHGSYSSFSSFNFSFNSFSHPSTPTSTRSRSPSISSLETIEDAPEQEEVEAEEAIERLKLAAAAESESDGESEGSLRRRSLEVPRGRRAAAGEGGGGGANGGGRKRWSVCGGERRADLDLETIWED